MIRSGGGKHFASQEEADAWEEQSRKVNRGCGIAFLVLAAVLLGLLLLLIW
jgi:hypothetical protein